MSESILWLVAARNTNRDLEHRITVTRELYDKWSDTVKRGSAGYTSQFRLDTRSMCVCPKTAKLTFSVLSDDSDL